MKIELPKIGQTWERDGLKREIVDVIFKGNFKENDYDVIWRRPGGTKTYAIWLPYWRQWRNKARISYD